MILNTDEAIIARSAPQELQNTRAAICCIISPSVSAPHPTNYRGNSLSPVPPPPSKPIAIAIASLLKLTLNETQIAVGGPMTENKPNLSAYIVVFW